MSQNHVIALPSAPKQRPIVCDYAGGYFRLTDQGVTFVSKDKDGDQLPPRWICSPLYVVAKTRDARSGEWGRLLEWQDDDGVTHQWAMPLALLQGDASPSAPATVRQNYGKTKYFWAVRKYRSWNRQMSLNMSLIQSN